MTIDQNLRDPHLAALVERIPDDVFARPTRTRRRDLLRWLRRLRER